MKRLEPHRRSIGRIVGEVRNAGMDGAFGAGRRA